MVGTHKIHSTQESIILAQSPLACGAIIYIVANANMLTFRKENVICTQIGAVQICRFTPGFIGESSMTLCTMSA
jgi:hypothetical protein